MTHKATLGLVFLLVGTTVWAQGSGPPSRPGNPQANPINGTWWRTPLGNQVGVSAEQRKQLDELWQQHRLLRIDLEGAVQKAQVTLEPLMQADTPDEAQVLAQIDRVTQAQAEVRKNEVRRQLAMRRILRRDQWQIVQQAARPGPGNPQPGPNGPPPTNQPRPPQPPQR